eukprot:TRINITY_DN8159_c0_g1_i1.p1 TRINITY_DN8159_c0_g1~~TRINITY_DN8159_c0_g1_i1.p1  ORF type:complete len:264 (+),score=26.40 TRINITY_DN8159_c0_g1_i1:30-794(+)
MATLSIAFQCAGHPGTLLTDNKTRVYKLLQLSERIFYDRVKNENLYPGLSPFIPKYFGVQRYQQKDYIVLEDLSHQYTKPCLLDIKVGTRTWSPQVSEKKKQRVIQRDLVTTTSTLGLRYCGSKGYNRVLDQYIYFTKAVGQKLSRHDFFDKIVPWFINERNSIRKDVCRQYIEHLKVLKSWLENSKYCTRFYSCSLLFCYEGASNKTANPIIKMIDFANVYETKAINEDDDGVVFGITNMINFLTKMQTLVTD